MKAFFLTISYFLFLLLFFACGEQKNTHYTYSETDEKNIPSDYFFAQRTDANGNFAVNAYTNGLRQAQENAFVQNRSSNGFDNLWTIQGPGNLGARVNTLAINPDDENIIYAGYSTGGVYKTIDGGENWEPIFDEQLFISIGDITLDPNDPNIVYVGTGDPNSNGFQALGDGVYRSDNAGETWTHLGLAEQRIISEVIVDPDDSNRIFASSMGLPFARNNERGLYRSEDNGDTWQQVLFLSDTTGVIDIVINPESPNMIFAAGWDRIRNNSRDLVSGFGGQIYKSENYGDDWEVLQNDLPHDEINGRIGLALCTSQPNVMYAQYTNVFGLVGGVYRSDNFGENWTPLAIEGNPNFPADMVNNGAGFYFSKIRVNPNDPDDFYLLAIELWNTKNGGLEWVPLTVANPLGIDVHVDMHDLVFRQDGSALLATDGGIYSSVNTLREWIKIENIPTNQVYRVGYNPHRPELYYGGLQDAGSVSGNAEDINNWKLLDEGDGLQSAFDTENSNRYFISRPRGEIMATLNEGATFARADNGIISNSLESRNFDMPYFISVHNNNKMVAGASRVYVSDTEFPQWSPITANLTDNGNSAFLFSNNNISAIHESPIKENLLFVGTADGNLWRGNLRDSLSYVKIDSQLPDQFVTDVVASTVDTNRVYVTYSGYRDNDNLDRIYRSDDLGESWIDISSNLPEIAINELLIIPERNDSIMFVATDAGVYGTVDAATSWARLGTNLPIISVYDLVYNEANNELVAATYGKSIQSYNITPITENIKTGVFTPESEAVDLISVFPNPAKDYITVRYKNLALNQASNISIVSLQGQIVKTIENIKESNVEKKVNISQLPSGQYFLKVNAKQSVLSKGFFKQ